MLVLISVGIVSVVSLGLLMAQEGAPEVGSNAVLAARARCASDTGIDLAEAILECSNINWRTCTTDGVLVQDFDYGGETVTIRITDLEGNVPTADCEYATVKASGHAENMVQGTYAEMYTPAEENAVAVDFSEFAVFATEGMNLDSGSIVRWKKSPRYKLREPLRIGTNATASAGVTTFGDSCLVDTILYVRGDASESILSDTSQAGVAVQRNDVTNDQDLPTFKSPSVDCSSLEKAISWNTNISFGTWYLTASKRFNSMIITGTAVLKPFEADLTAQILHDLTLDAGGRILIDHDMILVVDGDLSITRGSAIEVTNGAHLKLHVKGNVLVDDASALGIDVAALAEMNSPAQGLQSYLDPAEVKIYKARSSPASTWTITGSSGVRGMLYAPSASIQVDQSSVVAGCVFGSQVTISNGSYVHYDHSLDRRCGYTNPNSLHFSSAKTLDSRLLSYASSSGVGNGIYYVTIDGSKLTISSTPPGENLSGPDLSTPSPRGREVRRRLKIRPDSHHSH
ncbi:MAG: hypothetical protein D8M59_15985 [Planctomycetes bacterium]|nr:hypothetical protein [Planctomycetota bacterium]